MIKVKLSESYPNWYWNSANGVTLLKDNKEGIWVDENLSMIRIALDQGFLEVLPDESYEVKDEVVTEEVEEEVNINESTDREAQV